MKESCFPRMTNSVEICKQLMRSLKLINVKLKSKQIFKWKLLECAIYCVQCQDCSECQLGKLQLQITKVS